MFSLYVIFLMFLTHPVCEPFPNLTNLYPNLVPSLLPQVSLLLPVLMSGTTRTGSDDRCGGRLGNKATCMLLY